MAAAVASPITVPPLRADLTDVAPAVEPVAAAKIAGLRYVSGEGPGLRRMRAGKGFRCVGTDGRPVRDSAELARIRALVIPPAWTDVWICPLADGHLQATGRDDRGRKQYRYHARRRAVRDETKYDRMLAFGQVLPAIRRRTAAYLRLRGMPREKVLAAVVRLLDATHVRVDNDEYARTNGSYGLTSLRTRHVTVKGGTVSLRFRGKSGVRVSVDLYDPRVAKVVRTCRDLPGQELFQYIDGDGTQRAVESADVNEYLRAVAGQDFTAKDFRTWAGTVPAFEQLQACPGCGPAAQIKRGIAQPVTAVAGRLCNTPAVCRRCYIHPAVLTAYAEGALAAAADEPTSATRGLEPHEKALLTFLAALPPAAPVRVKRRRRAG